MNKELLARTCDHSAPWRKASYSRRLEVKAHTTDIDGRYVTVQHSLKILGKDVIIGVVLWFDDVRRLYEEMEAIRDKATRFKDLHRNDPVR